MHLLAREEAGLRCLLQVALNGAGSSPVPIAQIAAAEGLSGVYAAKLMRQLRLAGLVESVRGATGGYVLSRPSDAITVWDAIHALDDSFLPGSACDCSPADRIDCRRTTACAVASLWRRLGNEIRRELEAVSLASLVGGSLERQDRVELPTLTHELTHELTHDLTHEKTQAQRQESKRAPVHESVPTHAVPTHERSTTC